jgi:ribosomal protein L7/L12
MVNKITIINDSTQRNEVIFTKTEIVNHITAMLNERYDRSGRSDENSISYYYEAAISAVRTLNECGKKIQAIKLLRAFFPIGLKEAKDFVEAM